MTDDRYTVIAVDDETVSVMPHGDGWGGSIVDVPRQMVDGADITIGSQVSGWIFVEGEDVIAEMAVTPGASATKVKVRRRGDGWAHGQTTIPSLAGVDSDQERAWATQCGYWLGDDVSHFHDLRGHLQAKRDEADEREAERPQRFASSTSNASG